MRIGFLGKGGSGKTTIAAGYINYLTGLNKHVLAFDADVNVHLGATLGMQVKDIASWFPKIVRELDPNRPGANMFIGTTPPTLATHFITPTANDEFIKKYATQKENISLITIGTYDGQRAGSACYHSMLGVAEFIGSRLLDSQNSRVVLDMTAGIDSIGTGMHFIADLNIFVVEATKKSIDVYLDFKEKTKNLNLKTLVVINQSEGIHDETFVQKYITANEIIAVFGKSQNIKAFEQGENAAFARFVAEHANSFAYIETELSKLNKDWDEYYKKLLKTYQNNCHEWYNGFYGCDLTELVDKDFSYTKVLANHA
ncbi:MAG: hypothetical protein LBE20_00905 [Deltaproteobacteria bacterium]|jgi:CO dehydrogenase maturation factor|nr:hypothetical protein [Deltaproteobacteria bacterium]